MLKESDCKLKIHFDKLIIKNVSIQAVMDVLQMLTPEAVYLKGSFAPKYLSPLDIMAMQNINLQTLSSFHLGERYLSNPWPELQNIKTLKKLKLISGSFLSEKKIEYVQNFIC